MKSMGKWGICILLGAAALLLGSCKNSRMEPMEEKESLNEVVQGEEREWVVFAESLEEAHLMVVSGRGFMPVEFLGKPYPRENMVGYVPVFQNGKQLQRQYYAFWQADTVKDYVEDFAALLEQSFLIEK